MLCGMKASFLSSLITAVVLAGLAAGCASRAEAKDGDVAAATEAAHAWLAHVDAKEYGKSWDEAASFFKGAITRDAWQSAVAGVRDPLGKVVERKVSSATPATSLPGAPDGRYVVIQLATRFENKKSAVETITPMLDKDGKWRVSGYFIK